MVPVAKRPGWIVLASALVFHVLLLSLQTNKRENPAFMRVWLLDALVPAQKLVDRSIQGVRGVWTGYFALVGIRDENAKLHAENDRLRMEIQSQEEALREAARLRTFLGLADSGIGKTVAARIIGRDPGRSSQTLTTDKGRTHGVKINASVMTPNGVVGRVIGVGHSSSIVQLITDPQSAVAALLKDSRIQAVFKGTGGRELELDYIDDDGTIAVGDELITSGLDQIHPKGLPLAIVTRVDPRGELFKIVHARPQVEMARLEEVLILIQPGKPADDAAPPTVPLPSD
jgi:rod shape-determining protein MreC